MDLTNEDVEEIIRLLDASFYDELRLKTAGFDLCLRRSAAGWTQERRTTATPRVDEAAPPSPADTPSPATATESADEPEGVVAVRAPIVGTFYRAPKPGAPPFVEAGTAVDEHTVIGIIEVMKLMNSVAAGASGTIGEICVENGALVEAGQVLMRLRPAP